MKRSELQTLLNGTYKEVARFDTEEGVILIADGGSDDPEYVFKTVYFTGRNDDDLDGGAPLYFHRMYKDEQIWRPVTEEIRIENARIAAFDFLGLREYGFRN